MTDDMKSETEYNIKFREDEEQEFFTELALHETERWIQAVTKKNLQHPDDTRKSLENGVLLCQLLNCLQPGSITRINKLPTPIAGLDNVNMFLQACKRKFGLNDVHLFNPSDLEDLSQRAIAESGSLKQQYEKRLRNKLSNSIVGDIIICLVHKTVAITVYWLGKFARSHFQGPQLDLSAFSALIHHRHEPDIVEGGFHTDYIKERSRTSSSSSWDWSYEAAAGHISQQSQDVVSQSYEKGYFDNLDEAKGCTDMPMTHYIRGQEQTNAPDQRYSIYSSNPDLLRGGVSHRRYSSTDSMDGSHCSGQSGHSQQGSDSREIIYPTRRLNSQISRKSSGASDPLHFVKTKGGQDLAHIAEVQMRVAAESRKGSAISQVKDEDTSWQTELNSWKNRRKSQSEHTYHMREELQYTEKIGDIENRGKSYRQKFYPVYDDDGDVFVPSLSSHHQSHSVLTTEPESSKEEAPSGSQMSDHKNEKISSTTIQSDSGHVTKSKNEDSLVTVSQKPLVFKSFDNDGSDYVDSVRKHSKVGHDKDIKSGKLKDVPVIEHKVFSNRNEDANAESKHFSKNESTSEILQSVNKFSESQIRDTKVTHKNKEIESKILSEQDGTEIKSIQHFASRSQSKIGSILKNFEESSGKTNIPKQGFNEIIDMKARKSVFEHVPMRKSSFHQLGGDHSYGSDTSGEDEVQEIGACVSERSAPFISTEAASSLVSSDNTADATSSLLKNMNASAAPQPSPVHSVPNYLKIQDVHHNFVKKIIKISQKPNSERGFGFFLSGGMDKQTSLYVSKVSLGSAADVCDLKVGDTVLAVNQMDVLSMSTHEVGELISSAVGTGFIELEIMRQPEDDDIEEFTSSSNEEDEITSVDHGVLQTQMLLTYSSDGNKETDTISSSTLDKQKHLLEEKDFEYSGFEPPAILQKWQRQRQKEEYMFEDNDDKDSKIKPVTVNPHQDSGELEDLSVTKGITLESSQGWKNQIIDSARNCKVQVSPELQFGWTNEEQMEENTAILLEKHHAESRDGILQSTSVSSLPLSSLSLSSESADKVTPQTQSETTFESELSTPSLLVTTPTSGQEIQAATHKGFTGFNESTMYADHQMKTDTQSSIDLRVAALIEEERKRIREEELRKIEELRKRTEAELKIKEEEDKKRIQREEEELKKQREIIQLEKEKLLKDKEEFERIKEHEWQQHQYSIPYKQAEQSQNGNISMDHSKLHPISSQPCQSKLQTTLVQQSQAKLQPMSVQKSQSHGFLLSFSQTSEENYSDISHVTSVQSISGLPDTNVPDTGIVPGHQLQSQSQHHLPHQKQQLYQMLHEQNLEFKNDVQRSAASDQPSWQYSPSDSDTRATVSSRDLESNKAFESSKDGQIFSREEMMIMNRTSKPMLTRPIISGDTTDQPVWTGSPVTREAPSREEIHFLNSVPKAKFRDDFDWHNSGISSQTTVSASSQLPEVATDKVPWDKGRDEKRRSKFSMADTRDHWLVQEAERRRIAEYEGRLQSGRSSVHRPSSYGPIKPVDNSMNWWRQEQVGGRVKPATAMSADLRQTLLQKTAGAHNSNSPIHTLSSSNFCSTLLQNSYQSKKSSLPSQAPQHHQYNQQHQFHIPHSESQSNTQAPTGGSDAANEGLGSQLCSHCNHELGYGSAMVIESLGLYFHVQCFRCCVCNVLLGTGTQGADVRVRINKLHCPNCYSNDEAGLKLSQV